jgi:hypothetical protein
MESIASPPDPTPTPRAPALTICVGRVYCPAAEFAESWQGRECPVVGIDCLTRACTHLRNLIYLTVCVPIPFPSFFACVCLTCVVWYFRSLVFCLVKSYTPRVQSDNISQIIAPWYWKVYRGCFVGIANTRSDNKVRELATVCMPWQQWTETSVWFDDVGISAFHNCVVVDLQSLFEWRLLMSDCVLVCSRENVGAGIRALSVREF